MFSVYVKTFDGTVLKISGDTIKVVDASEKRSEEPIEVEENPKPIKNSESSFEVVSRMFKCELCDQEVKHTPDIIDAHLKMVHLISWKEYQEILIKIRQGETVGDLPAPELFECNICGVSVKYKREHLNKKHQITEDVYDELIAKKNRGEDISGNVI